MHTLDDLTCKIWDVEKGKVKTSLRLSSSGVAATWNPNNPMQVRELLLQQNKLYNHLYVIKKKLVKSFHT